MMLCKKGNEKDFNLNWISQRKYDGVRCWAICSYGEVELKGRSGKIYTEKFPEIVKDLKEHFKDKEICFDGELCCETFQQIQSRTLTKHGDFNKLAKEKPANYYIFDIIPNDISQNKPLTQRLIDLNGTYLNPNSHLKRVLSTTNTISLWEKATREGWEGIIIKNPNSLYHHDKRSNDWLKIKIVKSVDLEFYYYTHNDAGVRAETKNKNIAVQVSGKNSKKFLEQHEKRGYAIVEVEYLEMFDNGKLRMPVCKEVKE